MRGGEGEEGERGRTQSTWCVSEKAGMYVLLSALRDRVTVAESHTHLQNRLLTLGQDHNRLNRGVEPDIIIVQ